MIIKSLKLENIRSYTNQEFSFPKGSTLLSGDIGSGKSSILLAMEFALFGIMKGDLSGASLLRHGVDQGSAELSFELEGKEYTIKRYLKRNRDAISQESGFIMEDGLKKEGTAVELKAKVLEILGYPKELLNKSKSLIYRYTVYTPQEDMKKILTEEDEQRLNTLRKVFGIDKYKQIVENTAIVARNLRERKKELEGKIFDLADKQKQKEDYEKQIQIIKLKLTKLQPKIDLTNQQKNSKKLEIDKIEEDKNKLNELKNQLVSLESKQKEIINQNQKNNEAIDVLKEEITILKEKINPEKVEELKKAIASEHETKNKISETEQSIIKLSSSIRECEVNKTHSEKIKNQISQLNNCPTCKQVVSEEHKHSINSKEDESISMQNGLIEKHTQEKITKERELQKLKQDFEKIIENKTNMTRIQSELIGLNEKNNQLQELSSEKDDVKKEISEINMKKTELNREIEELKGTSEIYAKIKQEFDAILAKEKDLEIEKVRYESEINNFDKISQNLEIEIQNKLKSKEKLQKMSEIQLWLDEYFINLMNSMEKNIMSQVYHEFNELFQSWFSILIEDDLLNVRLDEQFSPVIEQNGFETELSNLSGGEKTSVALSYRLALNKVINDLVSEIKTKDVIILDEPTDGFSSEQLDKVRDVLDQLNTKQTILVSHESKIESFVDNIIKINKNEHISRAT